jgi:hypothetical protein
MAGIRRLGAGDRDRDKAYACRDKTYSQDKGCALVNEEI